MNYFNYFTEIEDAFVRRRGKHLFLSPLDWALMETWKEQDIPLHIVLRGVEKAFDSYESKPRKRSVKTLMYCQEEVEAQYAEWLESRVGASPATQPEANGASRTAFDPTAIKEHLANSRTSIQRLAENRKRTGEDEFVEVLERSLRLLEAIESDFLSDPSPNTRKLEDSLTGLERMLNQALIATMPLHELDKTKKELSSQLKPYKSQMEPAVYQQTIDNLLLKSLRERFGVPRLSLFYL